RGNEASDGQVRYDLAQETGSFRQAVTADDAGVEEARRRQGGHGVVCRRGEVEGPGEIARDRAAPGAQVGDLDSEAGLEEPKQRRVVERVRADQPAPAVGGDD